MLAVLISLFFINEFASAQFIQYSSQQQNSLVFSRATSTPTQKYKKIFYSRDGDDGKYRPEVYNKYAGNNGKYSPDDRGKYIHESVPYDGGYGDRGSIGGKYTHDDPGYKEYIKLAPDRKYFHNDPEYKDNQESTTKIDKVRENDDDDTENGSKNNQKSQTNNSNGTIYSQFPSSGFGDLKTSISENIKSNGSDSIFENEKNNEITNSQPSFNSIRAISNDNHESVLDSINDQQSRTKFISSGNHVNYDGWKIIRDNRGYSPPYHYLYETENKILAEETGRLHNMGNDNENIKAFGFYEYYGDDGKKYHIDYTADEYGYIPKGNHIHKAIQKALEYQLKLAKKRNNNRNP